MAAIGSPSKKITPWTRTKACEALDQTSPSWVSRIQEQRRQQGESEQVKVC